ncbi:hypothetical protein B0H17DRAFT_426192 [Mycena rosella]|uniref:Uncharacterized protein n=1 Tax=Mycena rosella TaxID=1033263 RepID=A0AAD7GKX2_MYCRO|nr:hypothetical protein B0H17DRAFT_426192 [Mycena rosella]
MPVWWPMRQPHACHRAGTSGSVVMPASPLSRSIPFSRPVPMSDCTVRTITIMQLSRIDTNRARVCIILLNYTLHHRINVTPPLALALVHLLKLKPPHTQPRPRLPVLQYAESSCTTARPLPLPPTRRCMNRTFAGVRLRRIHRLADCVPPALPHANAARAFPPTHGDAFAARGCTRRRHPAGTALQSVGLHSVARAPPDGRAVRAGPVSGGPARSARGLGRWAGVTSPSPTPRSPPQAQAAAHTAAPPPPRPAGCGINTHDRSSTAIVTNPPLVVSGMNRTFAGIRLRRIHRLANCVRSALPHANAARAFPPTHAARGRMRGGDAQPVQLRSSSASIR